MFVATRITVEVRWTRGSQEIDVGSIEYDLLPGTDFITVDAALSPFLEEGGGEERARPAQVLRRLDNAAGGGPAAAPATGESAAAPPTQGARGREALPAQQRQRGR